MTNPQVVKKHIKIFDCTVRDGAYLKGQQVTAQDTKALVSLAENARFDYVEVGHGLGIGGYRKATASPISDVDFCVQAASVAKRTKWGTFCIAGLCSDEELASILTTAPDFVRVGIDPSMTTHAIDMFKAIQATGAEAIAFFMKSYAWDANELVESAKTCLRIGVQTLYVVDSAGTMIPEDVTSIIGKLVALDKEAQVGFHGHNNLGLATANSLAAVRAGASIIDCSLMGVGRSSGNCVMEQFLFACMRYGISTNADIYKVLEFSESELPKIYPATSLTPADIVFGYSGFHSFFAQRVKAEAEKHGISYYHLIVELCRITRSEPSNSDMQQAVDNVIAASNKKHEAEAA